MLFSFDTAWQKSGGPVPPRPPRFRRHCLHPTHWFQFADDAAVITGLENEILLNHFTRWCTWAGMKIRVDKCSTFGIKKAATSSC